MSEYMGIVELASRFLSWLNGRKDQIGMFNEREIDLLEKMVKREIAAIDGMISVDPQIAKSSKAMMSELLSKIRSNPQLVGNIDILAMDEVVDFDEIVLAKNGEPMARIKLKKKS
jgi:phospholipid N-methyltransferase